MMRYTFWHGKRCTSDVAWLSEAVSSLKSDAWTKPLYFDGSGWEDPVREEAALRLLEALSDNRSASKIVFQNAQLGLKAESAFSEAMEANKSLRSVTLRNLSVQDGSTPLAVPSAVFANPKLESLTIRKCHLDKKACEGLSELLRNQDGKSSLQSLTLQAVNVDPQGLLTLIVALCFSRSLRELTLQGMNWSKKDLQRILVASASNRSLQSLNLEKMNLDAELAPELAKLLSRNKHLQTLSLRRNDLDADAIQVIMQRGLAFNTTLQQLFLSHNPLGEQGAVHLVETLQKNTTLHELCLVDTDLWNEGCRALMRGLEGCRGLRRMRLDANGLEHCGQDVVQMLQHNRMLVSILDGLQKLVQRELLIPNSRKPAVWKQVDFYLRANKCNRRFQLEDRLHSGLVPRVLEGASSQPDVLYTFLRGMPGTLAGRPTSGKRSAGHQRQPPKMSLAPMQRHVQCVPPLA